MTLPKNFSVNKIVNEINKALLDSISVKKEVINTKLSILGQIALNLITCLKRKGKIIIFGNGGSAADSLHIAAELVGRFEKERKPLPAIALTANVSNLTSLANDYGYEYIFSRQLAAIAQKKDIAWGISTSGNSKNIIYAINKAKELGLTTIAFTGGNGGKLKRIADFSFVVPSFNTARIQEVHLVVAHAFCKFIEEYFFNG
jgi:D-sedoheptulose 7-phosphate isomerase